MKTFRLSLMIFLWLVGNGMHMQAQKQVTDSLVSLLDTPLPDTTRIDVLSELYFELFYDYRDSSYTYLLETIELSQKAKDVRRLSLAYLRQCNSLWKRGEIVEARQVLEKAKQYVFSLENLRYEATWFLESGLVNSFLGISDTSIAHYLQAKDRYMAIGDTLGATKCDVNISILYRDMNQMDLALLYLQESVKWGIEDSSSTEMSHYLGNLGYIYKSQGDYDQALKAYEESLEIHRKLGIKRDVAINLLNIGSLYFDLGKYDLALSNYEESLETAKSIPNGRSIIDARHGIANVYAKKGNYQASISLLKQCLLEANEQKLPNQVRNLYKSLSGTYENMRNYKEALINRKQYENWKDTLINEAHLSQINKLKMQHETVEKEKQINLLTKENEIRELQAKRQGTLNLFLLAAILLICIIAALLIYQGRMRLRNQRMLALKNEELKSTLYREKLGELEMKALRAQMNPHFIFNCLNSINHMILHGKPDDASRYLTKFSKLIRMVLENSEHNTIALEDEIAMLEAYIQLEALRFKEKIKYEIEVDPEIYEQEIHVPSMILQPLVENAIWHGLMHKEGDGFMKISVQEEGNFLRCIIEDNGVGRIQAAMHKKKPQPHKNRSMGLQLTKERLNLINPDKQKELIQLYDIQSRENSSAGTRVHVSIPIKQA